MSRTMALAGLLLTLAAGTTARAQGVAPPVELLPDVAASERGGPGRHAGDKPSPQAQLFISPAGEPFRGSDGLEAWLTGSDSDHDGGLSAAEFKADARRFFTLLDADHDGVLDAFEIQAYERERVPEIDANIIDEGGLSGGGWRFGRRRGDAATPRTGREGAARYSLINEPQPVAAADQDLDGKVTQAEWVGAADRRFARLDRFKTGRLTRESLLAKAPPATR